MSRSQKLIIKANMTPTLQYWTLRIYSTEQTQLNTRTDPKSGPRVRVEFAQGLLWVRFSKICIRFWSATERSLCALMREAAPSVVTAFKPHPLYIQNTLYRRSQNKDLYLVAIESIHTYGTVKRFQGEHLQIPRISSYIRQRLVTLSQKGLNNSKIRDKILRERLRVSTWDLELPIQ